ncbi:hypothetical protein Kpol_223p4 [Vanderwaltozyma polyspora DSM 70294]|uniref:AAA+ ATPase domain-containing protein n=1 Tax=Vanderwaltozyma polyspora (strain ATCC 22028 / DSM 70294 / BCRC 21397 / CBS 2163 / NBRC 10782 / NRRL Y-8283 / UCD 57-17) TaxID=436907 RepID=A7TTE7_VANPO|nr:uncharacterized protein Kpol_223p4 [Vanderwaltozyma polyspora DSM 70294]EDO14461.1 hypothetical protein Kpol_223p4 [Vanderwaltozyma polyspora DSM 70294]
MRGITIIRYYATNASMKLSKNRLPKLPIPRDLKLFLDEYIIGQENSKKVLSVAVYNHYLRIHDRQRKLDLLKQRQTLEEQLKEKDSEIGNGSNISGSQLNSEAMAGLKNLRRQLESFKEDEDLELSKSNVLVVGPTGSGKTLLATTLARVLEVPIAISDCTQLTQAGYIGDDVEKCVERLLINADFDVAKAEKGIIVLDEIDKLAKSTNNIMSKDVSGEGVQQSLLKLIEGHKVEISVKRPVKVDKDDKSNKTAMKKDETFVIDTSNILFMIMGAFVGLDKHVANRIKNMKELTKVHEKDQPKEQEEIENKERETEYKGIEEVEISEGKKVPALNLTTPADLVRFGIIPELVGRVPIITALQPLKEEDLYNILREPKNALLYQYEYIFKQFGVKLLVTEKALKKVAEISLKEGTGARGLRGIMERLLLNVNYECPGSEISYVLVNEDTVNSLQQTEYSLASEVEAKFYKSNETDVLIDIIKNEDTKLADELERTMK